MGLFDYVRCAYPLPEGAPSSGYQTKDTPNQYMDVYEIRADGSIWCENVERRWVKDENRFLGGYMEPVSREWEKQEWTGEVYFYQGGWEFSAYFVKGHLLHIETLSTAETVTPVQEGKP